MENSDLFLLAVIVVAFIAGYSIVSFVVGKLKSQNQNDSPKCKDRFERKDKHSFRD